MTNLHQKVLALEADGDFEALALALFQHQAQHNEVYARYLSYLGADPAQVSCLEQIPFLPISAFKHHLVQTGQWQPQAWFESSGTTGQTPSRHALRSADWYQQMARRCWAYAYGREPKHWAFFALLPSYLERGQSSLVFMVEDFIQQSIYPESGFFLYNTQELREALVAAQKKQIPFVLWGVTYALLDFAEQFPLDLRGGIVIETGGMKGRRRELPKAQVHAQLRQAFKLPQIHTEYGMTELLSQAYALEDGYFHCPPTLRVLFRDPTDPLSYVPQGRAGAINVIDLANLDTCAFLATDDLGKADDQGRFQVLGRLDGAEWRGCNLLTQD
jgi:phenylacetate-coenzyme A ligase PaaK-like adenylate-forming protein